MVKEAFSKKVAQVLLPYKKVMVLKMLLCMPYQETANAFVLGLST
jgi:hypothetical protein